MGGYKALSSPSSKNPPSGGISQSSKSSRGGSNPKEHIPQNPLDVVHGGACDTNANNSWGK